MNNNINKNKISYCSTEKDVSEILPNLWLGNYKAALSQKFINKHNIECIINLTTNIPNVFDRIDYLHIPIKDKELFFENSEQLIKIYDIATKFIHDSLHDNKKILVHCKRGHHRSASIVAAYLIKYCGIAYSNATNYIHSMRKCALTRNTYMMKTLMLYK